MPGPGVPSLCSEHAFGYSLYVLRVGGPGSSRSRTLLYTFGAQHPALENKAVTAQPTAHVEPKLEAFLLLEVWAGCSTLPSQHPLPGFDHSTGFPKCSSQDHTASCLPPPAAPRVLGQCLPAGLHQTPTGLPQFGRYSSVPLGPRHAVSCVWQTLEFCLAKTSQFWGLSLTWNSQPQLVRLFPALCSHTASDSSPHNHYYKLQLRECVSCLFWVFLPSITRNDECTGPRLLALLYA